MPLQGLRVVSLAGQYPGPYATLLMADMGAEVILVEHPRGGDPARQFPGFHRALNRNKKSVTIDLKDSGGRTALERLLADADILLEGFRPGVMERLGFGHEAVLARFPRLIYVSISGFGQTGPYRDRPAHDLSYQAMAGLLFQHARSGDAGVSSDVAIGDLCSGMFAALGALSALHDRHRTDKGTYVDVSMTECLASFMTVMLGPVLNGGAPDIISSEPAYGIFRCADDKLLTLSIAHEDAFWKSLCGLLGIPEVGDLDHDARVANADSLRTRLARILETQDRHTWGRSFDQADIPWAPVNDLEEAAADPHFRARGIFQSLAGPDGRGYWHVAQPLLFEGDRPGPRSDVPALGEHNDELLGD